jgi:hypothetical protein
LSIAAVPLGSAMGATHEQVTSSSNGVPIESDHRASNVAPSSADDPANPCAPYFAAADGKAGGNLQPHLPTLSSFGPRT